MRYPYLSTVVVFVVLSGTLLATTTVCAQPVDSADAQLDPLIVTGTRLPNTLATNPNSITVITREEIEARNNSSVLDLLRQVPGLNIAKQGGRGGVTSVLMRGGEPNFTVVLIDGIKVNDPTNSRGGSYDFSTLNVANIERIEIVRGPLSAVYGSDALSGAINIITRSGQDTLAASVGGEVGSDDYARANAEVSGPIGDNADFWVGAAYQDEGDEIDGNVFESTSFSAKLGVRAGENTRIKFNVRMVDTEREAFPEDSGGPDFAVLPITDETDTDEFSIGATLTHRINDRWSFNGTADFYNREDDFISPGVVPGIRTGVPPNGTDSDFDRTTAVANATFDWTDELAINFGVDWQSEDGDSTGFVDFGGGFLLPTDFALDRDILGVFIEGRYINDNGLSILGSIRNDDPDESSSETTSKIGAQYSFDTGTTIKANWGEGFKLPSFFALGHALVGNPNLKPETSESYDVGIDQVLADGQLTLGVTGFHNKFEDLVDFDFMLFTNVNRDEVETDGGEFTFSWEPSDLFSLHGQLTYLDTDLKGGGQLRYRPQWTSGLTTLVSPSENWLFSGEVLYVDEYFDSSIPTGGQMTDSYTVINVNANWYVNDRLQLSFAVDNLFDEDYEESIGFPGAGIRPRVAATYGF